MRLIDTIDDFIAEGVMEFRNDIYKLIVERGIIKNDGSIDIELKIGIMWTGRLISLSHI